MVTYFTVEGDPDEVAGTGAVLRAMGQSFRARLQGPMAEIEAIDAERPWGDDEFGEGFETTYNVAADGSGTMLREVIRDGVAHAGERLEAVGDGTVRAMTEFQVSDAQAARDITAASDQ